MECPQSLFSDGVDTNFIRKLHPFVKRYLDQFYTLLDEKLNLLDDLTVYYEYIIQKKLSKLTEKNVA